MTKSKEFCIKITRINCNSFIVNNMHYSIKRVFRDQEELPTSPDLSRSIADALEVDRLKLDTLNVSIDTLTEKQKAYLESYLV